MKRVRNSFKGYVKIIQLIISITLLFYLYTKYNISFQGAFSQITEPIYLVVSVLISIIAVQLLAVFRWQMILSGTKIKERSLELLKINLLSIFWGIFLPSTNGSAAIRIFKLEKKHPDKPGTAGSTVVMEKLTGAIILCLLALAGSFWVTDLENILTIRSIVLSAIIIFSALFLLISQPKIIKHPNPEKKLLSRIINYINELKDSFQKIASGRILFKLIPITIFFHLITILITDLIFRAINIQINYWEHVAILPIIFLLALIPVSFSGFGIRESLYVLFYGHLGVDPEISFAVSILQYIIIMGIPAFLGGMISITSQIKGNFFSKEKVSC